MPDKRIGPRTTNYISLVPHYDHIASQAAVAILAFASEPTGGNMASGTDGAGEFNGPVGPLRRRCPQCTAAGPELLRCTGCLAIRYCSREYQVAHRPKHKSVCTKIRKARAKLVEEDHRIRNATPDFMAPANAFETHVGHFWGMVGTRDYMRARVALAGEHLLLLGTFDGVREGLEHM